MIHGVLEHEAIEPIGRDAGFYLGGQEIEAIGHQLAGLAHAGKAFRAVDFDLSGFA